MNTVGAISNVGQVGRSVIAGEGGGGGYSIEYQAVYDEFVVKPSEADAAAQDTFVETLVAGDVWGDFDRLRILASHASGRDSLLDWIHPATEANVATVVNAPSWVQYQGYTSNGNSSYINTHFVPNTDGVQYQVADASFGIYVRTAAVATQQFDYGTFVDDALNVHYSEQGDYKRASISINTQGVKSVGYHYPLGPAEGLSVVWSDQIGWRYFNKNGINRGGTNVGAGALSYKVKFALAANDSYPVPRPMDFSTRQQSLHFDGNAMSDAKRVILYNAFQTLMTYYGTETPDFP